MTHYTRSISLEPGAYVEPGFEPVANAFQRNFHIGADVGAALCIRQHGRVLVDIWDGTVSSVTQAPWTGRTVVCLMSASKVMVAATIHLLAQQSLLDLDNPVEHYWKEFGQGGKQAVTVRDVLCHRAGVPGVESLMPGEIYDWDHATLALAQQPLFWPERDRVGYHALTFGLILGAVAKRVTGMHLEQLFEFLVAQPLGLDVQMGLRRADAQRCAEIEASPMGTPVQVARQRPDSLPAKAWSGVAHDEDFNSDRWKYARLPGANGYGSARGLAQLYSALVSSREASKPSVFTPQTLAEMTALQHYTQEIVLMQRYRFASGVLLNSPPYFDAGPNPQSFGHHGAGGSMGFADPTLGLAFAYTTRRMHARIDNGPRSRDVIEALYRCLADTKFEPVTSNESLKTVSPAIGIPMDANAANIIKR